MKAFLLTIACCLASAVQLVADEPASPAETPEAQKHYLVELDCNPDDEAAVGTMLRTALALREDESEVTLFIDLDAVSLAKPSKDKEQTEVKRETDRLFAKLKASGVLVWVCPHCAGLQKLSAESLRQGLRFTSKDELDAARRRAEKVYKYRPAEQKAADKERVAGNSCKP